MEDGALATDCRLRRNVEVIHSPLNRIVFFTNLQDKLIHANLSRSTATTVLTVYPLVLYGLAHLPRRAGLERSSKN